MKMFRRISALALAIVMVCLFSASAFASSIYDYEDSYSFYDGDNTEVEVIANIEQCSTFGSVNILSLDAVGNEISIHQGYQYYPLSETNNIRIREDGIIETNVWSSSIVKDIASNFQMKEAEYSFSVTCVTSYGTDYCDFDSGVITYP